MLKRKSSRLQFRQETCLRPIQTNRGRRPGAGRKPNLAKHLLRGVRPDRLIQTVADIDIGEIVKGLLRSKKKIIRLQALNFIFDRIQGKPKQDVNVSGAMLHAHTRDPMLAALPKEALDALARSYDEVLSRYTVLEAAQDGPQNQIESKPANST